MGTPLFIKTARSTIPYVQQDIKFPSPPGQFHHELPLQAGAVMSDTGAEAIKPDPGSSWKGHSGGCVLVSGIKVRVLWGCPPTPCSIDDPPTAPPVCCCQRS